MGNALFDNSIEEVRSLGTKYDLDTKKLEAFLKPDRVIEVKIPVEINGEKKIFQGFRSQHDNIRGPYKGGIRFHQDASREEAMTLSLWMSIKTAVAGVPFGGGKGAVTVNPKELNRDQLEELSRGYVRQIFDFIGPDRDIPAPDVNTNPTIIKWMTDEYQKIYKERFGKNDEKTFASFTGKPVDFHGLEGRSEATGFGGVVILKELVKHMNLDPKKLSVAVHGFGNVGYHFADFASNEGFRIVSVSDSKGGVVVSFENKGEKLDIPLVMECKLDKGLVAGCYCVGGVCDLNEGQNITNDEILEMPVDILVPSALENVINKDNMKKIKAKIIIEMANGPISPEAYRYLTKKGVTIVPDILANSGGVTGSYIEWRQNMKETKYSKEESLNEIEKIMKRAFKNVWRVCEKEGTNTKEGAYLFALKELLK